MKLQRAPGAELLGDVVEPGSPASSKAPFRERPANQDDGPQELLPGSPPAAFQGNPDGRCQGRVRPRGRFHCSLQEQAHSRRPGATAGACALSGRARAPLVRHAPARESMRLQAPQSDKTRQAQTGQQLEDKRASRPVPSPPRRRRQETRHGDKVVAAWFTCLTGRRMARRSTRVVRASPGTWLVSPYQYKRRTVVLVQKEANTKTSI
jgi:hypothetical protein